MPGFETGLEHRLKRAARQMVDQHRHLGPIRAELAAALANGSAGLSVRAFRNFFEALEAHFRLEGEMFFPALHGLHPEFASDLYELDRDHVRLVEQLSSLGRRIEAGETGGCSAALEAFEAELGEHERREETLVERIVAAGTSLGI
jgi:hypothetical protein